MRPYLKLIERRIAAVTMFMLTVVAVYFLIIHWWFVAPLRAVSEEMETLQNHQQRYLALLAQRPYIESQLSKAKSAPESSESLLSEQDSGAATAQLMQLVSTDLQKFASVGSGCSMTTRMPITAKESLPYRQVKISINIDCGIEPLARLLYKLESERVSLFVDSLSIRRNVGQATGDSHRLRVQMIVSAYLRNEVSSGIAP